MKIVYLMFAVAKKSGTERILTDKMNYLAENYGCDVTLVTYQQGNHPISFQLSPNVKHIDINARILECYKYSGLKKMVKLYQTRRELKRKFMETVDGIDPDIIICPTYHNIEVEALVGCGSKYVKILESHLAHFAVVEVKKDNLLNRITTGWRARQLTKNISKADLLVALTQRDADDWSKYVRTAVIPNFFTYKPQTLPEFKTHKRIIAAGRVSKQKGYDYLADIWNIVTKKHPDWHLDIFGIVEEQEALDIVNSKIKKYGISETFKIHAQTDDIYKEYYNSDMLVLSSRFEGFPLVLIEAMACGLPCVSFDCPNGASEFIKQGTGYLIPTFDIEDFADKVCRLIENEDERKGMREKCRANAMRYLPEDIMKQWMELFKKETKEHIIGKP